MPAHLTASESPFPAAAALPALGKTALVIGGAQGAGYALARLLSEQGLRLVLTGPDAEAARMAARSLGQTGLACDPASNRDMAKLAYDVSDALGDIDVLVLSLGGGLAPGGSAAMAEADFLAHLQGQSLPLLHLARHFAPAMRARRHGAVVILGQVPTRPDPWQDAAAAWLAEATRALAREWAPAGLVVNSAIGLRPDPAPLPKFMTASAGQTPSALPLQRGVEPAELAQAALAFCRPLGGATGQVLRLDAGRGVGASASGTQTP